MPELPGSKRPAEQRLLTRFKMLYDSMGVVDKGEFGTGVTASPNHPSWLL